MQKLRVWWIPQIPGEAFHVEVDTVEEGVKIMETLAFYDVFQYDNNIKPDFSNAGGIEMLEDGEWNDWEIEDVNFGYYNDPVEYVNTYKDKK